MNPLTRSTPSVLLVSTLLLLGGCASTPGKVSADQLTTIRANAAKIEPGMAREKALANLERANSIRLSSALLDGVTIEEWKVEAFHDTGSGRDLFVTFLYFADGTLVDQSDRRIDYRANDALRQQWAGASGTKKG